MAGVRLILKYQWKSYWRRFMSAGQMTQLDMMLILLLGAMFIFKLPPELIRASRDLSIGQTARIDRLLLPLAITWFYSLIENPLLSITSKKLARYPLSLDSLLLIRIVSFFISPVAMMISAASLLGALPFLSAPHPFIGIIAAILFFITALSVGLSLSHFFSDAALRKKLMIAAAAIFIPFFSYLIAGGKDAAGSINSSVSHLTVSIVSKAAVAPNYRTALLSIVALLVCAGLALLLLRWSFQRSLSSEEVNRPPAKRAARIFRFPGRLSRLAGKEQCYFRKLPTPWIGLLLTIAYSQIFWLGAPSALSFEIIIMIVFLANTGLSANSFGLDEPSEINRYLLFPLRGRDILLGKNIGFAFIVAVQLSVTLPFVFWRLGWREVTFGLIEAVVFALAYLAWGNLSSVVAPFKMRFYRMESGGSIIASLAGLVICSLPGAVIIYLIQFNSELLAIKLLSVLSLMALAYLGSLHFAGRKFERDWQKISYRL